MPRGGRLGIVTRNIPAPNRGNETKATRPGQIEISVSDSGTGIDAAILEKVFEPFFTTKDRERGTGLGLATVKGIVEHAGGRIEVETELGVGSRFRITIPVTEDTSKKKLPSKRPARQPANSELILVVDDDDAVRRALCRILKGAGYRVVPAASSDQALIEHNRLGNWVDLIVTDILMPGTSGEDLVVYLRQKQPGLKVIFVTGYATSAVAEMGIQGEQRAMLPKPFDERRLLDVVCQVLNAGGVSDHEIPTSNQR
jgi:two-component system cell cycle sensor histidine kinase/response regulator CckA